MPESYIEFNLTERIFAITKKSKISKYIGFIVSDNTSNINSCIKAIKISFQAVGINWTERYHRIRYLAYIIYLTATAFFSLPTIHLKIQIILKFGGSLYILANTIILLNRSGPILGIIIDGNNFLI